MWAAGVTSGREEGERLTWLRTQLALGLPEDATEDATAYAAAVATATLPPCVFADPPVATYTLPGDPEGEYSVYVWGLGGEGAGAFHRRLECLAWWLIDGMCVLAPTHIPMSRTHLSLSHTHPSPPHTLSPTHAHTRTHTLSPTHSLSPMHAPSLLPDTHTHSRAYAGSHAPTLTLLARMHTHIHLPCFQLRSVCGL